MTAPGPLRVLQVIDALDVGGAERVVTRLAAAAAERDDVDVGVVTLRPSRTDQLESELEALGVAICCVPARTRHHLADVTLVPRLRRVLRSADVIQSHLGTANVLGLLAARSLGRPAVATLHSVALSAGEVGSGRLRQRASDLALQHLPTVVVAVGESVRAAHAERTAADRTVVIPNPAPPARAVGDEERRRARAALRLPDAPILVALGRLEPEKGLEVALDALAAAAVPARLVLAGDGSLRAALEARARALGVDDRVTFLGQVSDVRGVLAAADALVSSSHREGMPMAVLEAMATGLPVVATDVGDVAVTVAGGGVIVPPGDSASLATAIDRMLGDDGQRAAMASEALRLASHERDERTWFERWLDLWSGLPGGRELDLDGRVSDARKRASGTA